MAEASRTPAALVLAGGLALGAYQAGAVAALIEAERIAIDAVAGSSIGAIHAAILAGNPADRRVERLREFWRARETEVAPGPAGAWLDPLAIAASGRFRHASNWMNVATARLVGVRGLFRPRPGIKGEWSEVPSLYDLSEATATLEALIDFDLLNGGPLRCCIATTDVETAETVIFDTAAGDRIGPEHLLASGGLLPNFQPVRIDSRLLADGGFSANAPLEPILAPYPPPTAPRLCFLVDLFAPDAAPPTSLEDASARSNDMQYAAQTGLRLAALEREYALVAELAALSGREDASSGTELFHLSYRSPPEDAGPEKIFDFSAATIGDRLAAGAGDAAEALRLLDDLPEGGGPGLRIHRVRLAS